MSLAAALAADGVRPVSFLPTVKCSDCGDELQIAEMGDHVCGSTTIKPAATGTINPFTLRQMNARGQQSGTMPSRPPQPEASMPHISGTAFDTATHAPPQRPQRMPLPRINADAANKPFLAPVPPRPYSPASPAVSTRSGGSNIARPPTRNTNSPAPRCSNSEV